jgi:hypothetical protein
MTRTNLAANSAGGRRAGYGYRLGAEETLDVDRWQLRPFQKATRGRRAFLLRRDRWQRSCKHPGRRVLAFRAIRGFGRPGAEAASPAKAGHA